MGDHRPADQTAVTLDAAAGVVASPDGARQQVHRGMTADRRPAAVRTVAVRQTAVAGASRHQSMSDRGHVTELHARCDPADDPDHIPELLVFVQTHFGLDAVAVGSPAGPGGSSPQMLDELLNSLTDIHAIV